MEAILHALISALGWSIFHSLWQGAIIYGLLLLAFNLSAKKSASIKHNMAYLATCLIFAAFGTTFISLFKFPASSLAMLATPQGLGPLEPAVPSFNQKLFYQAEGFLPYLVSFYVIGLIFQLFALAIGYNRLLKLKKAARQAVPAEWLGVFEDMVVKLRIDRKIGFYLSEQVNVPLVIGYLKPIVLFPVSLATQLDTQQVEAILIHELSHIRRNDYLLNLIKTGIETVLFFNPFVWLIGKLVNMEREHACDDLVLACTGKPVAYAHALLKLEILKEKTSYALSMAATGHEQNLYHRIKRITDMKTNYMNAKQQFFAISLGIATIISVAWISPEKTKTVKVKKVITIREVVAPETTKPIKLSVCTDEKQEHQHDPLDTTKKKKFKIVSVDAKGNQVAYESLKDMPDSLREEVIKETFLTKDHFAREFKNTFSAKLLDFEALKTDSLATLIFRAQKGAEIAFAQSERNKEAVAKSIEAAKKATEIHIKALSNENVKAEIAATLAIENGKILDELREKHEARMQLENSPEYRKLKKKFDQDLEKIKKKKGIKSDINFRFNYSYRSNTEPKGAELPEVLIK